MDLALFDFDGTITVKDTYTGFIRLVVGPARKVIGGAILSPVILANRAGLMSDVTARPIVARVAFGGDVEARARRIGEAYAADVLPGLTRPVALERIAWHRARGDRIVVVSASLDLYLDPWCRANSVEVICTRLEAKGGRLTGRCIDGDCSGDEKARRIRAQIDRSRYETVYAYGDTEEDRPMLEMADKRFFRWQEL
jgi:phosphatidylglycerophosphatase C